MVQKMCKENIGRKIGAIIFAIVFSSPVIASAIIFCSNGSLLTYILSGIFITATLLVFVSCGICIFRGCSCECLNEKLSENAQEDYARLLPLVIGSSNGIIHDIGGLTARCNRSNLDINLQDQVCNFTEETTAHPARHSLSTQHHDRRSFCQVLELPQPPAYDSLSSKNGTGTIAYYDPPLTHDSPPPIYDAPPPTYDVQPPTYDAQPPGYDAPPPPPTIDASQTCEAPPPAYDAPPPAYDTAAPTYDAPPPTIDASQTCEAPPPTYDLHSTIDTPNSTIDAPAQTIDAPPQTNAPPPTIDVRTH
ncbi:unnamed protein product [Owenia fusiformis]|uniref:Uncharacterized protein n=1 Tax=Owenia fusiformis TaxID=6347 RepID=A0A8S4Q3G3_OWEFU|nr:unnamed protein product [Owenia fusiformis]